MKKDISKVFSQAEVDAMLAERESRVLESIRPFGRFHVKITRHDGQIEERYVNNIVLSEGLNRIANRAVNATGTSPFYIIGVGTQTAAHSLASDQPGFGEVSRKTSNVTGSSAQSREYIFLTQTWGGAADSVTSVVMDTAFVADFPNSHASTGAYLAAANGLGVTLANSDFLALTYQVRVGSHNLSHST